MKRSYAIIGCGALGGLYGAMLHRAGLPVHFLLRTDYYHVRDHGLQVDSPWGDSLLRDCHIYNCVDEMPPVDVVAICWKTTANHRLSDIIPPLLHSKSVLLLIQNGLQLEAELAPKFPNTALAGGVAYLCSNKIGPGHIHHLDYGKLVIGPWSPGLDVSGIVADFEAAGVPCEEARDLSAARWRKLVWNIPFNGLCALHDLDTRAIMEDPLLRQRATMIMEEVSRAAGACGACLPAGTVEQMLELTAGMTPYLPSMQLDRRNGIPPEYEYLFERPLSAAEAAGVAMPETRALYLQLQSEHSRAGQREHH